MIIFKQKEYSFRDEFPDKIEICPGVVLKKVENLKFIQFLCRHFEFIRKQYDDFFWYDIMKGRTEVGSTCIEVDSIDRDTLHIALIEIEPEFRNRGYATALLNFYIKKGRELGYKRIRLEASRMGYPLYKKIGFTSNREPSELKEYGLFTRFINWSWGFHTPTTRKEKIEDQNFDDLVDMEYKL